MGVIIGTILEALAEYVITYLLIFFGTIFFYTGEVILKLLTLGRHKLQPNPYKSAANHAKPNRSIALGAIVWLGPIVWGVIASALT